MGRKLQGMISLSSDYNYLSGYFLKLIFHLATFFARREAKTRIRQRDCLRLAGEKIRCQQVGSVPTFLSFRANKFAKWKIGFNNVTLIKRLTTTAAAYSYSSFLFPRG